MADPAASRMGKTERDLGDCGSPPCSLKDLPYKPEAGFVTLLVMLLLTVFFLHGLEGYENATGLNRMARREAQSRQAVYAAEGGIEWAKSQLAREPVWQGGEYLLGERRVVVTAKQSEGGYWVISSAQAGLAERDIQVFMKIVAGHWTVLRYRELHL